MTEKSFDGLTFGMGEMTTVFISSELDICGLETAYHEAFHVLKRGNMYKHHYEMIDIISGGINVESEAFEHFVSAIAELYSYNVKNVSLDKFSSEIIEEFYAWYIGEIYARNSTYDSDMLGYINDFSNADAIKAQLDEVYEKIKADESNQVPNVVNDPQLTSETPLDSSSASDNIILSETDSVNMYSVQKENFAKSRSSTYIIRTTDGKALRGVFKTVPGVYVLSVFEKDNH